MSAVATSTLSSAYSSASAGSTVLLTTGTTFQGTCSSVTWSSLCVDKIVTIKCEDISSSKCKVDGASSRNIFRVANSKTGGTPVFDGLLFQNGSYKAGGGVWISSSLASFSNCDFKYNDAPTSGSQYGQGGALYGTSSVIGLTSCLFTSNTSSGYGGGIYTDGLTNVSFLRVTFSGNNDPTDYDIRKVGQPVQASDSPTKAPSKSPTIAPTTLMPTPTPPSKRPTSAPTQAPTFLGETRKPTVSPSKAPTKNPTKVPTRRPTVRPTRAPTAVPTPVALPPKTASPTSPSSSSSSSSLPLGAIVGIAAGGGALLLMLPMYYCVVKMRAPLPPGGPSTFPPKSAGGGGGGGDLPRAHSFQLSTLPSSPGGRASVVDRSFDSGSGGSDTDDTPTKMSPGVAPFDFSLESRKSSLSFSEKHGMVIKLESFGGGDARPASYKAASAGSASAAKRNSGGTPARKSSSGVTFTNAKDDLL